MSAYFSIACSAFTIFGRQIVNCTALIEGRSLGSGKPFDNFVLLSRDLGVVKSSMYASNIHVTSDEMTISRFRARKDKAATGHLKFATSEQILC